MFCPLPIKLGKRYLIKLKFGNSKQQHKNITTVTKFDCIPGLYHLLRSWRHGTVKFTLLKKGTSHRITMSTPENPVLFY